MSGWSRLGIRAKLFSVILLILSANLIILLFAGSYLFERFYTQSRISELKNSARNICEAYDLDSSNFYDEIGLAENENAIISLIAQDENGQFTVIYHSRAPWDMRPDVPLPPKDQSQILTPEIQERIGVADEEFDIWLDDGGAAAGEPRHREEPPPAEAQTEEGGYPPPQGEGNNDNKNRKDNAWKDRNKKNEEGFIALSARVDENLYLYMFTPRGYIKSTADLAVKYTALLSIAILLVGAALIYMIVWHITKPLKKIQSVTDKLTHLDFSEKCEVTSGDEISMLAQSINDMSGELEASIEKLVSANEVLKNDLVRQQQTEQLRRQFVASVSHDFKTPLTLIISYAEALGESQKDIRDRECCETIISEGNRLSKMVGRLLELSRLESGVNTVEKSLFCLSEIVDGVIKNHRILTEKKQLTVERCMDESAIVEADYAKMEQVVTNLFENAVKYTPDKGEIRVRSICSGGLCRMEIENTGVHITEEDISHLFDSFYRSDKARTESSNSYGIGLAIVRVVMEAHNRAYGVENTRDGVCFWVEMDAPEFEDEAEEETDSAEDSQ